MQPATTPISRTHLISCVGIDREYALLGHFLHHYLALGVPPAHFHITLHTWQDTSDAETAARTLFEHLGLPEPEVWSGHWSGAAHWRRRREEQERLPPDHWVLHADADELHEYPTDLNTFLEYCERRGVNCVQGPMIDRVTNDGRLAVISESEALSQTFPLQADVRYLVGWCGENYGMSGTVKIMAARSGVLPRSGGHGPHEKGQPARFLLGRSLDEMPQLADPHFRFSVPMKVHHYKWNGGLRRSLSERRANAEESAASHEFSGRLDNYLAEHDRIEIRRLPIDTHDTPPRPWQRRIQRIRIRDLADRAKIKLRRLTKPRRLIKRLTKRHTG